MKESREGSYSHQMLAQMSKTTVEVFVFVVLDQYYTKPVSLT